MPRAEFSKDEIDLAGEIIAETELAVLFFDGACRTPARPGKTGTKQPHDGVWLPKSKVEIAYADEGPGQQQVLKSEHRPCTITLPEWLAYNEGLI